MLRLARKTAVVTGGNRGIGRATAERLAADGARVSLVDLAPLDDGPTGSVRSFVADVSDPVAMEDAMTFACGDGRLDICVANAGVITEFDGFLGGGVGEWERTLRVNLLGVLVTFQAAVRRMVGDGRGGRLLATSSNAGLRGEAGVPAYCASKAGVVALVQSLAVELAPEGITVNAVAPGEIDTAMNARVAVERGNREGRSPDQLRAELVDAAIPARRIGRPAEVAALFAFLASDEASYITGETIRIDGGQTLT